jgi:hypothetical protein
MNKKIKRCIKADINIWNLFKKHCERNRTTMSNKIELLIKKELGIEEKTAI